MSKLLQERWLRLAGLKHAERGSAPIIKEQSMGDSAGVEELSLDVDEEILGIPSDAIWEMGLNCQLGDDQCSVDNDPSLEGEEV